MNIIIVLGCRPDNYCKSREIVGRAKLGAFQFKKNLGEKIVLSGGFSNPNCRYSEAKIMKRIMVNNGVPGSALIMEENSLNTIENALYTRKLLDELKIVIQRISLVTSCYHINRSKIIFNNFFKEVDIDVSSCFEYKRKGSQEDKKLKRDLSIMSGIGNFNDIDDILNLIAGYIRDN